MVFFLVYNITFKIRRNEYSVLKGSYTAIFASVIVHVLLLIALILASDKKTKLPKQDKAKAHTIKSFLYKAPKKVTPKLVTPKKATTDKVVAEVKPSTKPIEKQQAVSTPVIVHKKPSKQPDKASSKKQQTQITNAVKSDTNTTTNKVPGTSRGNFSSYDSLSRLRKKLDSQQRDNAFAELTQKRSASAMDGEQFPVPKTIVPLTTEQEYKKNTSTSHVGSITKNDDGTCTIYRAQVLGSPVEATTSRFACGESKFDKNFREHMQKVKAKLGQ